MSALPQTTFLPAKSNEEIARQPEMISKLLLLRSPPVTPHSFERGRCGRYRIGGKHMRIRSLFSCPPLKTLRGRGIMCLAPGPWSPPPSVLRTQESRVAYQARACRLCALPLASGHPPPSFLRTQESRVAYQARACRLCVLPLASGHPPPSFLRTQESRVGQGQALTSGHKRGRMV